MNYGLPVVASTVANEGIKAREGEAILIADSAEDFTAKIGLLFEDKELWSSLSRNGREFVKARFTWDRVVTDYLEACARFFK